MLLNANRHLPLTVVVSSPAPQWKAALSSLWNSLFIIQLAFKDASFNSLHIFDIISQRWKQFISWDRWIPLKRLKTAQGLVRIISPSTPPGGFP